MMDLYNALGFDRAFVNIMPRPAHTELQGDLFCNIGRLPIAAKTCTTSLKQVILTNKNKSAPFMNDV